MRAVLRYLERWPDFPRYYFIYFRFKSGQTDMEYVFSSERSRLFPFQNPWPDCGNSPPNLPLYSLMTSSLYASSPVATSGKGPFSFLMGMPRPYFLSYQKMTFFGSLLLVVRWLTPPSLPAFFVLVASPLSLPPPRNFYV